MEILPSRVEAVIAKILKFNLQQAHMGVVFMCSNTFGHVVYIQRICVEIGCLLKIVRLPTPHLARSEVTREFHRRARPGGPWSPITLTLNCHTV